MNELDILKQKVEKLEQIIDFFVKRDRYLFQRDIELFNGNYFRGASGLRLGKTTTEKIGLYGVTPVVQASAISAPGGGANIDAEARTAIDAIRLAIKGIGITA